MHIHRLKIAIAALALLTLLLAACGGSSTTPSKPTPPPTPTPGEGQQLLAKASKALTSARTMHAIFNIAIAGPTINGTLKTEVWNEQPDKNRTVVLDSTISQFPSGEVTVTDGKQAWEYIPSRNVVYNGPVTTSSSGTPTSGSGSGAGQSLLVIRIVQSILTNSQATLVSSSASVNGHAAYDIHITPKGQSAGANPERFNYDGDVFLDKTTDLPLRVILNIQGIGKITLDALQLTLNQPIDEKLFTFTPPPGVKVEPFPTQGPETGTLTLQQAEQQAGYHLLSIPASQTDYQLLSVDALGAPGNQVYTLNYQYKGNTSFSITEGKALANLPTSGTSVKVRGTNGSISSVGSTNTLTWTENGVGIQIAGPLSNQQLLAIAQMLT